MSFGCFCCFRWCSARLLLPRSLFDSARWSSLGLSCGMPRVGFAGINRSTYIDTHFLLDPELVTACPSRNILYCLYGFAHHARCFSEKSPSPLAKHVRFCLQRAALTARDTHQRSALRRLCQKRGASAGSFYVLGYLPASLDSSEKMLSAFFCPLDGFPCPRVAQKESRPPHTVACTSWIQHLLEGVFLCSLVWPTRVLDLSRFSHHACPVSFPYRVCFGGCW